MKIKTEILDFTADAQLLQRVEKKVSKLTIFFNRISEVSVVLKKDNISNAKSVFAEVKIHVPNGIIFTREKSSNIDNALTKALICLKLELLRYRAKRLSYGLI